jgi:3-deoxy-manno-octulosonate cytidylyltransferase (CMP-KDO synthetase)
MASTRFPNKPLALIDHRSMIEHVYARVASSPLLAKVVIATCDQEIIDAAAKFGAVGIMTANTHERASDRCHEAMMKLAAQGEHFDVAVMVQGDEPMTHPEQIAEVLAPLQDEKVTVSNLCLEISDEEAQSLDVVKVVMDQHDIALYFSRAVIPGLIGNQRRRFYKQLGLMAFRRAALQQFAELPPTPHEKSESVDMLRFLEHRVAIRMVRTAHKTIAVDTPADLERVKAALKSH